MPDLLVLKNIVEEALREHESARLGINVVLFLVLCLIAGGGAFFGSYLKRKGENLATKEDVTELTRRTEEIRNQYAALLENLSYENRLRMAAIERRLNAHQQAFALWRKLMNSLGKREGVNLVITDCRDWWSDNCLYLDAESREAFSKAFCLASLHEDLANTEGPLRASENWEKIEAAGEVIVRGISLPPIRDIKRERILTRHNENDSASEFAS